MAPWMTVFPTTKQVVNSSSICSKCMLSGDQKQPMIVREAVHSTWTSALSFASSAQRGAKAGLGQIGACDLRTSTKICKHVEMKTKHVEMPLLLFSVIVMYTTFSHKLGKK